ncbi:hypothetical protein ACI8AA_07590 [Geodermatophilus sp. SYSU D01180]
MPGAGEPPVIVAAALLVLAGLGLFVAGVLTAVTAWYWACVGACALAAVLLVVARLRAPAGTRVPAAGRTPDRADAPARREPARSEPARSLGKTADRPAEAPGTGEAPAAPGRAQEAGAHAGRHEAPETPDGPPAEPAVSEAPAQAPAQPARSAGAGTSLNGGDTPEEDVEVTDLLTVVDLTDEVLVVDEHPRYHLADCPWLAGRETIPLPVNEARTDGFTPCAVCGPDAHLAAVERARRAARRG